MPPPPYDALLLVSFGGPERREDVLPFLENVLRGRNVPHTRMLEVAEHYYHFGGVSPINAQCRELIDALRPELDRRGVALPVYWGNRNWHPLLPDTVREMAAAGVSRALAFVTAAYSSYSSCRQYRENIESARQSAGPAAPQIDKLRAFYNHPLFIQASADRLAAAMVKFDSGARRSCRIAFTAHSIPVSMARQCAYVAQLTEICRLVAGSVGLPPDRWELVYQSRSGRPEDPWLGPDIGDHLQSLADARASRVVIAPVGFLSDHLEVLYDLDCEARQRCDSLGLSMVRAATVGTHPVFVRMIAELIDERLTPDAPRRSTGIFGPSHDECPAECCPGPNRSPFAPREVRS